MTSDLIRLDRLGGRDAALAGGKGANLGELTRIAGVRVPPGFCVSTEAFRRVMTAAPVDELLDRLSSTRPTNRDEIRLITVESDIHAGLLHAMGTASSEGSRAPAEFRCVVDLVETYLIDLEAPSTESFCSSSE
jgi:phosphoenolpyruvate synthase/pyruvate phosphate dikinase